MRRLIGVALFAVSGIAQQPVHSMPANIAPARGTGPFVVDGNQAWFVGYTMLGGELHVTDGTVAGTRMLFDFGIGPFSGVERLLGMIAGRLLFEDPGHAIWTTDGTLAGTTRVPTTAPIGTPVGVVNDRFLYLANPNASPLYSLAVNGTVEVLHPWTAGPRLLQLGNRTFLHCSQTLFETDGTAAGTTVVRPWVYQACVAHGRIWCFDSTAAWFQTTLRVFDPATGTAGPPLTTQFGLLSAPVAVPGGVVFVLNHRVWTSDGTVAGTRPLTLPIDDALSLHPWRDRALIVGHDIAHDVEPWISDGTEAGTYLLADLLPGPSNPWSFATTPQGTYFRTAGPSGARLMFTDGTAAGTRILSNHGYHIRHLVAFGNQALFSDDRGAWLTDAAATTSVQIPGGTTQSQSGPMPAPFQQVGDTCLLGLTTQVFATNGPGHFQPIPEAPPSALWTAVIGDHVVWPHSGTNNTLHLSTWDHVTAATTSFQVSTTPSPWPSAVTAHDDRVFVTDIDLHVSDGAAASTTTIGGPIWYLRPNSIGVARGRVFLCYGRPDGLWTLDPTNTWRCVDTEAWRILGAFGDRVLYLRTDPWQLFAADGGTVELLAFGTQDLAQFHVDERRAWNGRAWLLWYGLLLTDGTAAGTQQFPPPPGISFSAAAALPDAIYLLSGNDVWKFDGASYTQVPQLVTGTRPLVTSIAACGDRLFLSATDGTDGLEPYLSDGTPAGTFRIADLMPGPASSMPRFHRVVGDYAYFEAQTPGFANLMAIPLGQLGVAHSERIGQGCSGRNGIPQLTTPTPPRLGDPVFRFELTRGAPFAPVIFATDTTTSLVQLGPCRLRCAGGLGVVMRATNGAGTSSWTQSIPNAPQLLGLHVTAQAAVLDSLAAGPGFALSTTLGCVVGAP